jgi:hypothetical protein
LPAFLSESGQTVKVTGFKFRSEICLLRHQGAIHDEQARHYGDPGIAAGKSILQPTDERRRTGSHYTPRTLTAPIAAEPSLDSTRQ